MRVTLVGVLLVIAGCGSSPRHSIESRQAKSGDYFKITERVFVSGLPKDLDTLKSDLGIDHIMVVSDGSSVVGVQHRFDIVRENQFDLEGLKRAEAHFQTLKGNVLILSSEGDLAAAWLTYHFRFSHRLPVSDALLRGQAAGLKKWYRSMETFLYLNKVSPKS